MKNRAKIGECIRRTFAHGYTTNLPNIPSLDVFIEPDHRPRPQNEGIHVDNAIDRTTAQMEWALDNGRPVSMFIEV